MNASIKRNGDCLHCSEHGTIALILVTDTRQTLAELKREHERKEHARA